MVNIVFSACSLVSVKRAVEYQDKTMQTQLDRLEGRLDSLAMSMVSLENSVKTLMRLDTMITVSFLKYHLMLI